MFHPVVSEESIDAVQRVMRDRWIGQGAIVDRFEDAVCDRVGASQAVAVTTNAAAVRLALALSSVGPGDEVITTPLACTATNHPILEQFATPVFADIQAGTGNIDPRDVERRITHRTRAVICYDWGGYPSDLDELSAITERHGLALIEDASEALGASYHGRQVGGVAPFTVFSFQAINLVTTGEGGMLCTRDDGYGESARAQRWYGIDRKRRQPNDVGYYDFDVASVGYGYHMTNMAAAMGLANLDGMDALLERRRQIAARYRQELRDVAGLTLSADCSDRIGAYHAFTVHVERRTEFCKALRSRGVESSIVHARNDDYSVFGGRRGDLPVLDRFTESYIALPCHPVLTDDEVSRVIASVREGW